VTDTDPPSWEALERPVPEWFADATFGVYFHWGPYSVPAHDSEWYPRNMYREGSEAHEHHVETYGPPSEHGYREFVPDFHGDDFDPEAWADLCAEAGADFAGLTAVHHDGFAMWDSDLTDWNAVDRGPGRDVFGDLADALRDRGIRVVAAFHHAWRWWYYPRAPEYDTTDPDYADLYGPPHEEGDDPPESYYERWRDMVFEVFDAYRPDLTWFDFGWGLPEFLAHDDYRREVVAGYHNRADDWGKEVAVAHKRNLPVGVGVVDHERSRRADISLRPWLTDTSVDRSSWGYVDDPDYKDAGTLVRGLVDRQSKNGRTLLNVGPRPDGTVPETAADRLRAVGEWLDGAGAAVRGTRPWWVFGEGPTEVAGADAEFEAASAVSFTAEDLRFTRREGEAYAVVMAWPDDGRVEIETSLNHRLSGRGRAETLLAPEQVELLGAGEDGRGLELDWTLDEDALRVDLPDERPPGLDHACALRLVHPGE
jgi:alpha-L-fucosidase